MAQGKDGRGKDRGTGAFFVELRECAKIEDPKVLNYLIEEGRVSWEVVDIMVMESLSSEYGWTPDQIDKMDPNVLAAYLAINAGRNDATKTRIDRKTKKVMR